MRIITGLCRGRKLTAPEGLDVRPTTDKVKEAMFSIIQFELEGARVLDLFAGTGQLGLEALSRGADSAVFVDASARSLSAVKRNIGITGFQSRSETVRSDALSFLARCRDRFDIVFLDPPYDSTLCAAALAALPGIVKDSGAVVCETRSETPLPDTVGSLDERRDRRYGVTRLTVYRKKI